MEKDLANADKEQRKALREQRKQERIALRAPIMQDALDMVLAGDRRGYLVAYLASLLPLEDLRAFARMGKKERAEFAARVYPYMERLGHLYPPPEGWSFLQEPLRELAPKVPGEEPGEAYLIVSRFAVLSPVYRALLVKAAWDRFRDSPSQLLAALRILSRSDEVDRLISEGRFLEEGKGRRG